VCEKVKKTETPQSNASGGNFGNSRLSKGPACSFLASLNTGTCYLSLGLTESRILLAFADGQYLIGLHLP